MGINTGRILLNISMVPASNPDAERKARRTYQQINNVLTGVSRLPNIVAICNESELVDKQLSAYIRNECLDLKGKESLFNPQKQEPRKILNAVEDSQQKRIRIMLFPGEREDIGELKMNDTTHNMILQFGNVESEFNPAEKHENPPSFYQVCSSVNIAILYLEALLVDACFCHYMGISDAALKHDDKQRISLEKVSFIKEICESEKIKFLTPNAANLVKYVCSKMGASTPYISFLSIFTIAPYDCPEIDHANCIQTYFSDYCNLWLYFQKWYYERHGRLFSKDREIISPLKTLFDRNVYQGQISPEKAERAIKEIINQYKEKDSHYTQFGKEYRYSFVIIRNMPGDDHAKAIYDTLFSGKIHQAQWTISHIAEIDKFDCIKESLEIVPFMIEI